MRRQRTTHATAGWKGRRGGGGEFQSAVPLCGGTAALCACESNKRACRPAPETCENYGIRQPCRARPCANTPPHLRPPLKKSHRKIFPEGLPRKHARPSPAAACSGKGLPPVERDSPNITTGIGRASRRGGPARGHSPKLNQTSNAERLCFRLGRARPDLLGEGGREITSPPIGFPAGLQNMRLQFNYRGAFPPGEAATGHHRGLKTGSRASGCFDFLYGSIATRRAGLHHGSGAH